MHYNVYHIKVDFRYNIRAKCFVDNFVPKFLSPFDFRMIMHTLTEYVSWRCHDGIATTVPMAVKARKEYSGTRTFDGRETKFRPTARGGNKVFYMSTVTLTIWKAFGKKNSARLFCKTL